MISSVEKNQNIAAILTTVEEAFNDQRFDEYISKCHDLAYDDTEKSLYKDLWPQYLFWNYKKECFTQVPIQGETIYLLPIGLGYVYQGRINSSKEVFVNEYVTNFRSLLSSRMERLYDIHLNMVLNQEPIKLNITPDKIVAYGIYLDDLFYEYFSLAIEYHIGQYLFHENVGTDYLTSTTKKLDAVEWLRVFYRTEDEIYDAIDKYKSEGES